MQANEKFKKSLPLHNQPKDIAYRTYSKINADRHKRTTNYYLLLEGESDESLFVNFIDAKVTILPGKHRNKTNSKNSGGKTWVRNVMEEIQRRDKTALSFVFAIIDSDYDKIVKPKYNKRKNIFFIEPNSLGTMMWSLKDFRQKLSKYLKILKGDKKTDIDFEKWLVSKCNRIALDIGLLRLTNEIVGVNMDFKILKNNPLKYIKNQSFDSKTFLSNLNLNNLNKIFTTLQREFKRAPTLNSPKIYDYLNDHDIVRTLSSLTDPSKYDYIVKKLEGTSKEDGWLVKNFQMEEFKKTILYKKISKSAYAACLKN